MPASTQSAVKVRSSRSDRNSVFRTMTFQALLTAYLQVVEWIPLGRWNNVANGNGQAQLDLVIAITQIVILILFWRRWRWLMAAGTIAYGWWAWLEIQSWWIPYFFGGSAQWMDVYNRWFKNTYRFLPAIDGHPIPDAEHTVLIALIACVLISGVIATLRLFRVRTDRDARTGPPPPTS